MEKLLQSLCSAQSAKDIEGRIFNEDETKLPPSQTYETSEFSCIISRIHTVALHFLILRNGITFAFSYNFLKKIYFTITLSVKKFGEMNHGLHLQ